MDLAIFGYGSLINRRSAENALKRKLSVKDMTPVTLEGYFRRWRTKENLWFDQIKAIKTGIFLDLDCHDSMHVNGVLIDITLSELNQLKLREKNYDCLDVSEHIATHIAASSLRVFTFVAKKEYLLRETDHDAYIPMEYINLVETGCKEFGDDFLNEYHATTEDITLHTVMPGHYRFVDPIQSKYV